MEPALLEVAHRLDREPRKIDEDFLLVEDAHERHEMEARPGTGTVRKRHLPHLNPHRGYELSKLIDALGVGAVPFSDQNRAGVEPDDIASFGEPGGLDASEDRDTERLEESSWRDGSPRRAAFPGCIRIMPASVGKEASWA